MKSSKKERDDVNFIFSYSRVWSHMLLFAAILVMFLSFQDSFKKQLDSNRGHFMKYTIYTIFT